VGKELNTMKKIILSILLSYLCFFSLWGQKTIPDSIKPSSFGKKQPDIPCNLTREKSNTGNTTVALLFSGDGGWFGFEQSIADKLALAGISTIGIDARKYFWYRKTPEETTNDMASLLSYYATVLGKSKFMLIGYSLGAELVPFVANRLPLAIKSNLVSVVMLSPEATTDFEIHISNMLGLGNKQNTYNVIEEITRMKNILAICIFGENEKSTVPGLLKDTPVKIALIPGDHHFKGNCTLIVQTMKNKNAF
jgi:type IV secretory pathway VirJ component